LLNRSLPNQRFSPGTRFASWCSVWTWSQSRHGQRDRGIFIIFDRPNRAESFAHLGTKLLVTWIVVELAKQAGAVKPQDGIVRLAFQPARAKVADASNHSSQSGSVSITSEKAAAASRL
jgi:hypothetical protein